MRRIGFLVPLALALGFASHHPALVADGQVGLKNALKDDRVDAAWIYDDLEAGIAQARKTGKPLLIAFR